MATELGRVGPRTEFKSAFILSYDLLGQSIQDNTSTFRIYAQIWYGGGTYLKSDYCRNYIAGVNVFNSSYNLPNGTHTLGYYDIAVRHNNDGTFPSYYVSGSTDNWHQSGSTGGYLSAPTIPRQANVTGATDFNDEGNPRITFTNPAGFRINARLEFAGTVIRRDNIANTGSYTFDLTSAERDLLRSKCSNSNTLTVREVIATCVSGTTESYWSWQDKTMTIINANPTFYNFNFEDINSKTVSLTGNNQNVIIGYSNVRATIPLEYKATANKQASMSKYSFTCSDIQRDIQYSSDKLTYNDINNVKSGVFNVYAIDSRNNSTLVTKNANKTIAYNPLVKREISISRQNGVSEVVSLSISGTIDLINFGQVVNSITESKYRYKVTDSNEWSNYKDINVNVDNNGNITYNSVIQGDTNNGFNIANSYNIEVLISDELSTIVFTANLVSGIPNIALHKNGVGIMGKYNASEGGLLQVAGRNIFSKYSTTERKTNKVWKDNKDIYEITFELGSLNAHGEKRIDISSIPFDTVTDLRGFERSSQFPHIPILFYNSNWNYTYVEYQQLVVGVGWKADEIFITMEYTKTTD